LTAFFDKFGRCSIKHKGSFAFVEYTSKDDAKKAIDDGHGNSLGGLRISIEWSHRNSGGKGTK
jgi:hypothetical protein